MAQAILSLIWHIFLIIAALIAVGVIGVLTFLWKLNKSQEKEYSVMKGRFNARASRVESEIDKARGRKD